MNIPFYRQQARIFCKPTDCNGSPESAVIPDLVRNPVAPGVKVGLDSGLRRDDAFELLPWLRMLN